MSDIKENPQGNLHRLQVLQGPSVPHSRAEDGQGKAGIIIHGILLNDRYQVNKAGNIPDVYTYTFWVYTYILDVHTLSPTDFLKLSNVLIKISTLLSFDNNFNNHL